MKYPRAEELQIEDNKARYDKRDAYRKELIENLIYIMNHNGAHANLMAERLKELGLNTEEGFDKKSPEEMCKSIKALIAYFREASSGVLTVGNSVKIPRTLE